MMSGDSYHIYKTLKAACDFNYRGFEMAPLMATQILLYAFNNKRSYTVRELLKNSMTYDASVRDLLLQMQKERVVTYFYGRKDYVELVDAYIEKMGLEAYDCAKIPPARSRFRFNAAHLIRALTLFPKLRGVGLFPRLLLVFKAVMIKNTIDDLLSAPIKIPKCYFAFNSSFGTESLLTQFYKIKGAKTYSLQHSVYYAYPDPAPYAIISYENIVADKLLCWGQYSVDELLKFGVEKERLILFGNPKYPSCIPYNRPRERFQSCLLLLGTKKNEEGNTRLIHLLAGLAGVRVDIKPHPSLDEAGLGASIAGLPNVELVKSGSMIHTLFTQPYDFVVSYNSTTHNEAIACGKLCFGYAYRSDGARLFEQFEDRDGLSRLLKKYEAADVAEVADAMKSFAVYTLGAGIGVGKEEAEWMKTC